MKDDWDKDVDQKILDTVHKQIGFNIDNVLADDETESSKLATIFTNVKDELRKSSLTNDEYLKRLERFSEGICELQPKIMATKATIKTIRDAHKAGLIIGFKAAEKKE
jgi:hypothetical protein